MVTFLIAGHETTSGLLSFTTYLLLRNPEALRKARGIVDEVLGADIPRVGHLIHLGYIEQILMETLRIWPTAAVFAVKPLKNTLVGGKYAVTPSDTLMVLAPMLHRDPSVWGEDVEAFRPERFNPEKVENLPANAWKPFGNGRRACIGRPFAMQEAQLVLAMMLKRFDIAMDDPSYKLEIAETLTIKPRGFRIRARVRTSEGLRPRSTIPPTQQQSLPHATPKTAPLAAHQSIPLLLLYGSNTGSSEAFAHRIAGSGPSRGYAPTVAPLDDYAGRLPKDSLVIVLSASYEGQPPDNARQFVSWVEGLNSGELSGLKYAVFGCGNRQWPRTYQAIPIRIDAALEKAGATRLRERGETDASGDFFGAFDGWYASLWNELDSAVGKETVEAIQANTLSIEIIKVGRESALRLNDLRLGTVIENQELVDMRAPSARSKRHIEIELPAGMTYRSGDYLAVLARNPQLLVERALRRFGLAQDTQLVIHRNGAASATLPVEYPVSAFELLSNYVELAQPATRAQLTAIGAATRCPPEKKSLEAMVVETAYETEVLGKRLSVLDLLDRHQSCELGLAEFLFMLPPMRSRQYSISSSPLWKENHVTLTLAVVDAPALSGKGRFQGVASTYLAGLAPGARVSVAVRPSNTRFHPPNEPSIPIIMVCAGTGVAPFHGFLQERSIQMQDNHKVGRALLFFGVDHPEIDYLYRDEFTKWEKLGVVQMLPAFSAAPDGDVKFVQHRVWKERTTVAELFRQGAVVYVCGDGKRMAPAVRQTFIQIYRDAVGATDKEAVAWADKVEHEQGRYVSDVFA
jgi:cytochrome P450 / NADPH-cytochrome P450 reductase